MIIKQKNKDFKQLCTLAFGDGLIILSSFTSLSPQGQWERFR
jgi:hypothetical protein